MGAESLVRNSSLTHNHTLTESALLRAMAEKLIPGISHATRIAILQQSENELNDISQSVDAGENARDKSVLEYAMSGDGSRNEILRKLDGME